MNAPLVIICTCHSILDRAISRKSLEEGVRARRPATNLEFVPSLCAGADLDALAARLEQDRPESLVIAACSPFARGRAVLAGLAARGCTVPAVLADLREGCAWIHSGNPEAATAKAVDLVSMALAGPGGRETSPRPAFRAERRVLVVGAGPAGLAAAGTLARLGVPVSLADRLDRPGGLLNRLGKLFPRNISGEDFLAPLIRDADHDAVEFLPKTAVKSIRGDPGAFEALLSGSGRDTSLAAGAVILACGALPVLPEGRFGSGELSGVISQLELETKLQKLEAQGAAAPEAASAVFIQCVAARDDTRPYCSTICCPTALKNAIRLKALKPEMAVTVLHRGIMAPGRSLEELYRRAMAAGVRFAAYDQDSPPQLQGNGRVSGILVADVLSGRRAVIPADLAVLSTPLKPRPETAALAEGLGVRTDRMGFVCGREPVQPLAAPVPGVYLCGAARWPVSAGEAVEQGRAAAVKAAAFLSRGEIDGEILALSGPIQGAASIRTAACGRCGQCVAVCPYQACRRTDDGSVEVSILRCRGCGLCAAVCPSGAARIPEHDNTALRAMIREIAPRTAP